MKYALTILCAIQLVTWALSIQPLNAVVPSHLSILSTVSNYKNGPSHYKHASIANLKTTFKTHIFQAFEQIFQGMNLANKIK